MSRPDVTSVAPPGVTVPARSNLQRTSTLCSGERLAVIFADGYQINHAVRFVHIRPEETEQMPVRPWR